MDDSCKHDWRNSIKINAEGTLDNIVECENCGVRNYLDSRDRPEHLRHLPNKRYNQLVKIFSPRTSF